MSKAPKSLADSLAGMLGIVKVLEAMEQGSQITYEMIADVEKVNGECPPQVRQAITELNRLHKLGINKQTVGKEKGSSPSSDYNRVEKNPANFLPTADEDAAVVECVLEFLEKWGKSHELSEKFPLKVASSIFHILGTAHTNDGGAYQMNILKVLDMTREAIVDDMLAKKGRVN